MRKHNQIHTLSTQHCKAHFQFLRKLKDFGVPYGPKNTVITKVINKRADCDKLGTSYCTTWNSV